MEESKVKEPEPRTWDDRLADIENDLKYCKEMISIVHENLLELANQEFENSQTLMNHILVPKEEPRQAPIPFQTPPPPPVPPAPQKPKWGFLGFGTADYSKA